MKKKDLEKRLKALGWYFSHHGGEHDAWTNGSRKLFIPRHNEVKELTAKQIIKDASKES
jgi:mRNA interferase HicA